MGSEMKTVAKKFLNRLGYQIVRAPGSASLEETSRGPRHIEFLKDAKFEIEFIDLTLDGSKYFVPKYALHRPAVKNLLKGKLYEPETHDFVRAFFQTFKGSMIHAGTFFGDMIPNFSRSVSGTVYAFEPVFENYILAKLCVDNNSLTNVILMNSALSEDLGNLCIDTSEDEGIHAGGSSTISDEGKICAAINIDRLEINDLVLIQLDVEGHELTALRGAKHTIKRCRPVIAIEDNSNNCKDYLCELEYERIGSIPGLSIWSPSENDEYKNKITNVLL